MKLRPLRPLLGLAVATLLAAVSPDALLAQEAADSGITVRLQGGPPAGEDVVDEALLRYLAGRGDRAAAEAEIARLKELHPDWEPPTDLFGGLPRVDEGPLWQLYETGDYAAVRSRIDTLRKERPDWSPPGKLLALMAVTEARSRSEAAAAAGDWATVLAVFEEQPAAATCENIDNLWRLAEGQQRTGAAGAAAATYARIITTCPDADQRYATLQKAKLLVAPAEFTRLVGLEKARAGSPDRLAKLETLTAAPATQSGKHAAGPSGPDFSRIYKPTATVQDARAVADAVVRRRDAAAARKIGWIYQAAGDDAAAAPWFQRSLDWTPSEEAARGLAMSLAATGRLDELDALALRYPAVVTQARGGQVAVAVERGDLATVLKLTGRTTKPAELLMRSWTYMKLMRPTEAQLAFARVMATPDAMPLQRDEAVYGLIRAQIAQHLFQDAARSIERYGLPPEQYNEVQAELLSQEIQVAFRQKDYRRTVALLEKRRDYALPDRGLEIQEAWARYHNGEVITAKRIFTRLDRIVSTEETEAGLAQVSRKLGPGW